MARVRNQPQPGLAEQLTRSACPCTWLSESERAALPMLERWRLTAERIREARERTGWQPPPPPPEVTRGHAEAMAYLARQPQMHEPCRSERNAFVDANRRALFAPPFR